jgi:uncharacterized protein (DUF1684 family)
MKLSISVLLIILVYQLSFSQDNYKDSLNSYISNYVQNHEVVTGGDKESFRFYPINEKYNVIARFKKAINSNWFSMETSGVFKKTFRVYGSLHFSINDTSVTLNLYQSQSLMNTDEYQGHLFLPFEDLTSGEETYESGRYIDLLITDIVNNQVIIDFNKAYNPYCAYVSGKYNCPIPPDENQLPVAIPAGEKIFAQPL